MEALSEISVGPADTTCDLEKQAGCQRAKLERCRLWREAAAVQGVVRRMDHLQQSVAYTTVVVTSRLTVGALQLRSEAPHRCNVAGAYRLDDASHVVAGPWNQGAGRIHSVEGRTRPALVSNICQLSV
jgi:hypothetical protein